MDSQEKLNGKKDKTPALRFPEFINSEEWEEKKLGEYKLINTINAPIKVKKDKYLETGLYPIIDQSQNYINGWINDDEAIIQIDHPVIIFGDHTCVLKLINFSFAQGADGIKIFYSNYINNIFLYYYLKFINISSDGYNRHFGKLKEQIIFIPNNKEEQQKIADCLSTLDEMIEAEEAAIEKLKEYKKGLMSKLFPADDIIGGGN